MEEVWSMWLLRAMPISAVQRCVGRRPLGPDKSIYSRGIRQSANTARHRAIGVPGTSVRCWQKTQGLGRWAQVAGSS